MPATKNKRGKKGGGKRGKKTGLYMKSILTRKIVLPFNNLGSNLQDILSDSLKNSLEGKCIIEGFVRPATTNLLHYTAGRVTENGCSFEVIFEAHICKPVEGMKIKCVVKNVTKAGIRAERETSPSPIIVFIARDHNYDKPNFSEIKLGDIINIKVLGHRYELNDPFISIIAELIDRDDYETNKSELQK